MKADKSCLLSTAKGDTAYRSQQREQLCMSVCRDFRHLLENSVYKLFWSRVAMLASYSYRYIWSLFNSFFFLFQLAMKHKCWDTAQSWNLLERNWKGYVQQFLQEIQTTVCFFLPVQRRCILSVSVQEKVLHFYLFDLLLFLFCNIATQSCSAFYLFFSCYRSESKQGNWTKWQADQA